MVENVDPLRSSIHVVEWSWLQLSCNVYKRTLRLDFLIMLPRWGSPKRYWPVNQLPQDQNQYNVS